jgi:hypothetical protein
MQSQYSFSFPYRLSKRFLFYCICMQFVCVLDSHCRLGVHVPVQSTRSVSFRESILHASHTTKWRQYIPVCSSKTFEPIYQRAQKPSE